MAVPFTLPEDQNEVEVIINQLQSLLTRLQAAVRRSQSSSSVTSRVRSSGSSRSRSRGEDQSSSSSPSSSNIPDLLNNLAWLAAASEDSASSSNLSQLTTNTPNRRRTSSESSCCEETKISITAVVNHGVVDWNQVGVTLRQIADDYHSTLIITEEIDGSDSSQSKSFSSDGFLSKLVPGSAPFGLP